MQSLASDILEALRERIAFGVLRSGVRLLPVRLRAEVGLIIDVALKHVETRPHDEHVSDGCTHGRAIGCHPWPPFDEIEPCSECSRSFGRGERDVNGERAS